MVKEAKLVSNLLLDTFTIKANSVIMLRNKICICAINLYGVASLDGSENPAVYLTGV